MYNLDLITPAGIAITANTAADSDTLALSSGTTAGIPVGAVIVGPGIPDFAVVRSFPSPTQIVISSPAYATGTGVSLFVPIEPVSLADVKAHLRVEHTEEDSTIAGFIAVARERLEDEARRVFLTKTYDYRIDNFGYMNGAQNRAIRQMGINPWLFGVSAEPLVLPYGPITEIISITYRSSSTGAPTVLDPAMYRLSPGERARVEPAFGTAWPATMPGIDGVTIRYVAGYGDTPAEVPVKYRQAIKMLVSYYWECRSNGQPPNGLDIPDDVMRLIGVAGRGYS
jgi:hypothetical protein